VKSHYAKRFPMFFLLFVALPLVFFTVMGDANAALYISQSTEPSGNSPARSTWIGWLTAAGITSPEYQVNFETSTIGDPVSGLTGLTISEGTVQSSDSYFGGSNPVGSRALALTEGAGTRLTLNFSAYPVDYVAFQDIDQASATVRVTFSGGGTESSKLDTTGVSGDSAEFFGVWRNDKPRITMVEILDVGGSNGWGVDNIEYGQKAAPVPIPAAAWLLGSGLVGLVAIRRRLRKN